MTPFCCLYLFHPKRTLSHGCIHQQFSRRFIWTNSVGRGFLWGLHFAKTTGVTRLSFPPLCLKEWEEEPKTHTSPLSEQKDRKRGNCRLKWRKTLFQKQHVSLYSRTGIYSFNIWSNVLSFKLLLEEDNLNRSRVFFFFFFISEAKEVSKRRCGRKLIYK